MGYPRFLVSKLFPLMIAFWGSLWLLVSLCNVYYRADGHMQLFNHGDAVFVEVNSLTSTDSMFPFSYYSLPFCKPPEVIKNSGLNLGQNILGDEFVNSPYRFRINVSESVYLCTTEPLTADDVRLLNERVMAQYQMNLILDNLPVRTFPREFDFRTRWDGYTGFPVGHGYHEANNYVLNHLMFRILLHEEDRISDKIGTGDSKFHNYTIVGFQVVPASMKRDTEAMMNLTIYDAVQPFASFDWVSLPSPPILEGERVTFTYEVEFFMNDISWRSRWDKYVNKDRDRNHWFFVMKYVIYAVALGWALRKELTKWKKSAAPQDHNQEEEGAERKMVIGNVFREPTCCRSLCVLVGNGVQIAGTAILTVLFVLLGVLSPVSRGLLLTVTIYLYVSSSIVGGYVSVRLWTTIKATTQGWRTISWAVSCFFPGITFLVLTVIKIIQASRNCTGGIPVHLFVMFLLWFCIIYPLSLLGGYLGTKAGAGQLSLRTNHIIVTICKLKIPSWLQVIPFSTFWLRLSAVSALPKLIYWLHFAALVSFGVSSFLIVSVELVHMFISQWFGRIYYMFGFLLIALLLFFIIFAEFSAMLTFMCLRIGDSKWWWKSFFASAIGTIYIFIYSAKSWFLLDGTASIMIYIGYSLIIFVAIMLSAGAIGFLSSLYSVSYVDSLVKID